MKLTQQHQIKQTNGVGRLEYLCSQCQQGYYHFDKDSKRLNKHNQLPHKCTNCGKQVYFTIPYPALFYKGRIFVDWKTIRGVPIENQ